MGDRLFTKAELAEMGKRTVDRLKEAVDAGDADKAKHLADRMYAEFLGMHDLYRDGTTGLLSHIGRKYGDEVLEEAMTEWVRAWWGSALQRYPKGPEALRQRVKMFAAGLRGHLQPLHIEEDDEKVVIQMEPCGSGGRLVLEGKYEGPDAFLTIEKPQRLTYGRADFPVYCAHEPPMEIVDIEMNGAPFVVVEPALELGRGCCSFIIYKDPDAVPDRYYERLGLERPARRSAG